MLFKDNKNKLLYYFTFFTLIFLCYLNVILYPQINYDDFANVFTPKLIGNGLNLQSFLKALTFKAGGFRPISYISFYLNYYLFGGSIRSFVIINVIIHYINTILLFKISLKITKNEKLSFVTALLWAVSPINSFAVSYIVQRMTSLMAMFGLIGTLYFLTWEDTKRKKDIFFSILFVLIASLCKENGVLFFGFFLIYHYTMYGNKKDILELYLTGLLTLFFLYFFSKNYFMVKFIERYTNPFEHFLTEIRALSFYIINIIWPLDKNIYLSIDFLPSKNILNPISTLYSLFFLTGLIVLSFIIRKKDKIITLGILGFFCFHLLESSFLPLYRVFLHRNYIPSFFLLLATTKLIFYLKHPLKTLVIIILFANITWVTVLQNLKWRYKIYYIYQNAKQFPHSLDAKIRLGLELESEGKFEKALQIYLNPNKTFKNISSLSNIANILTKLGYFKEVIALGKTIPDKDIIFLTSIAKSYANLNNKEKAKEYFRRSFSKVFSPSEFFSYILWLYDNELYDEVVFECERYNEKIVNAYQETKQMEKIINTKTSITKIFLLKIECKLRINLANEAKKDVDFLKQNNLYYGNIKKYILGLFEYSNKNYTKALTIFKSIKMNEISDFELFLSYKRAVYIICCYEKLGKEKELEQFFKNNISPKSIFFGRIWNEMNKCY